MIRTVHDLMGAVARKLTGEAVIITYDQPQDWRLRGTASRNLKGTAVINLAPGATGHDDLFWFLHECAHVVKHNLARVGDSERAKVPKARTTHAAAAIKRQEDQADTLAKTWLEYGRAHARPDLPEYEGVLTALLQYPQDGRK